MEEQKGFIRKVTRRFEKSGDIVGDAELDMRSGMVPAKVIGPFDLFVREGDWFIARGVWKENTWNGKVTKEFKAYEIVPDLPRSVAGSLAMLDNTFTVKDHGVDIAARKRFVDKHGANAAFKAEKDPAILLEMSSDPGRYGKAIHATWARRMASLQPVRILESAGAKGDVCNAILKRFKDETLDIIKSDPYRLMSVKGVDFKVADKIAEAVGMPRSDPRRVSAALKQLISVQLAEGDTYIPTRGVRALVEPYGVEWDAVQSLARLVANKSEAERLGVTIFDSKVGKVIQKYETYRSERAIAVDVANLVARGRKADHRRIDAVTEQVLAQEKFGFLSDEQRRAVATCSREAIAVLTGGPGTGKSTVSDAIAEIAAKTISGPVLLTAPTGKAARRLSETTGREAKTVHKLLGAKGDTGDFLHNRSNPLPAGCFVLVDESSMLDTKMTQAILDALPPDGRILFVGDKDQLPSVDAGYVLGDLLAARAENGNTVPSAELTEVFRSKGADNLIAPYAKEIKEGVFDVTPVTPKTISSGVAFFEYATESIHVQVKHLFNNLSHTPLGLDPMRDMIILAPMRKGRGGTHEINRVIQTSFNTKGAVIDGWIRPDGMDPEEPTPRVKDRVMFTKNDTDLGIRNGDVGVIEDVVDEWDKSRRTATPAIVVKLESDEVVKVPVSRASHCTVVAYAITGHKSQGSQYKCVVMPISPDHEQMLERTLIYTEWTRAKRYVVMVGDKEAFTRGVANTSASQRLTLLKHHIADCLDLVEPTRAPRPARPIVDIRTADAPSPRAAPSEPTKTAPPPQRANPFSSPFGRR